VPPSEEAEPKKRYSDKKTV